MKARLPRVFLSFLALAISFSLPAQAAPITFTATGNANVVGYVTFDDADFDGTDFQLLLNTDVVDLSIVAFGASFTLTDVVTSDLTIIDSSGPVPLIVNGVGLLASNGAQSIAFFPDGFGGTALDGDASLAFSNIPVFDPDLFDFYQVKWEVLTAVPEPTSLALFGVGAALLARRRRIAKA